MAKFEKGNAGKPKGAKNKATISVKNAFAEAFNELQKDKSNCLLSWGKENPTEFYKLASKLIPTELAGSIEQKVTEIKIVRGS